MEERPDTTDQESLETIKTVYPTGHVDKLVRKPGAMQGQIYIADDFDAPLPDKLLSDWFDKETV